MAAGLLIFSDMPTFAEVLNLKNNWVGMMELNQLGPIMTDGLLQFNSDIRRPKHGMGAHDVAMHNVGVRSVGS